jgi:hypothetical protein
VTDPVGVHRVRVTASGSETLPLDCESKEIATVPSRKHVECFTEKAIPVKGKLVSQDTLPPYSLADPRAFPDGCTLSSILSPQWTFSDFMITGNSPGASTNDTSTSTVYFEIILKTSNQGFQRPMLVWQDAPVANSSYYSCAIGTGGNTGQILWPQDCTFQFIPSTKELTLKANWICSELDSNHP